MNKSVDEDYMNMILENEKNLSNNISIAIDEASCDNIFNKFYDMFDDIKETARDAFNIIVSNNWYSVDQADSKKIETEKKKLEEKIKKLK